MLSGALFSSSTSVQLDDPASQALTNTESLGAQEPMIATFVQMFALVEGTTIPDPSIDAPLSVHHWISQETWSLDPKIDTSFTTESANTLVNTRLTLLPLLSTLTQ